MPEAMLRLESARQPVSHVETPAVRPDGFADGKPDLARDRMGNQP